MNNIFYFNVMATFFNIIERAKEIEDEQHFIFQCNSYSDLRKKFENKMQTFSRFLKI